MNGFQILFQTIPTVTKVKFGLNTREKLCRLHPGKLDKNTSLSHVARQCSWRLWSPSKCSSTRGSKSHCLWGFELQNLLHSSKLCPYDITKPSHYVIKLHSDNNAYVKCDHCQSSDIRNPPHTVLPIEFFVILVFGIWLPKLGIVQCCLFHFSEASLSLNSHNIFCYRSVGIILFVVVTIVSICENSNGDLFSFTPMVQNSNTQWMAGQIIEHSQKYLGNDTVQCLLAFSLPPPHISRVLLWLFIIVPLLSWPQAFRDQN